MREHFPELVFDTVIPRNVRIGEAPSYGRPVIHHDPHCARRGGLLRARQGGGRPWLSDSEGMGRGLAAILSRVRAREHDGAELRELAVELISPESAPAAPAFDEEALLALADSIERARRAPARAGAAARRRAATSWSPASAAGAPRSSRASRRCPAIVRERDDAESLELALIENMAREDLNPVEEARACAALVEELGLTREEVGRRVGRSRVAVSQPRCGCSTCPTRRSRCSRTAR